MSSHYQINTAQNVTLHVKAASLGSRIGAYLIDGILKLGYILIVYQLLDWTKIDYYLIGVLLLPLMFYSLLFEVFNNGQSPGKKILQIQVQSIEGGEVTVGSYLLRWLLRIIDFTLLNGLVAFLAISIGSKNQRVGDMAAGTTVVSLKDTTNHSKAILGQFKASYTPIYEGAEYLSDNNIAVIKKILNTQRSPGRTEAIMKLIPKIENIIGEKNHSRTPVVFLSDVVKDYYFFESGISDGGEFE